MEMKLELVPFEKINDAFSGGSLFDAYKTMSVNLTKAELANYANSIIEVQSRQKLNLKDALLLDRIDQLTFENNGFCFKDSLVTKARIKACKRYGIKFNDRDGLVNHMNLMLGN